MCLINLLFLNVSVTPFFLFPSFLLANMNNFVFNKSVAFPLCKEMTWSGLL